MGEEVPTWMLKEELFRLLPAWGSPYSSAPLDRVPSPLDLGMSWASGKETEDTQATSIWSIRSPLCTPLLSFPVQLPQQPRARVMAPVADLEPSP